MAAVAKATRVWFPEADGVGLASSRPGQEHGGWGVGQAWGMGSWLVSRACTLECTKGRLGSSPPQKGMTTPFLLWQACMAGLWGLVWEGASMNGEDLTGKGQGQALRYSHSIPKGENLRLVAMARGILGHLVHLLPLWMKKWSHGGEKRLFKIL